MMSTLTPSTFDELAGLAQRLFRARMFSNTVRDEDQALAVLLRGFELNVSPFTAARELKISQSGSVYASISLMKRLAAFHHGPQAVVTVEATPTVCTLAWHRHDGTEGQVRVSLDEIQQRGGGVGGAWTTAPSSMLFRRALQRILDDHMPEVWVLGLRQPEAPLLEPGRQLSLLEEGDPLIPQEAAGDDVPF
jgi:hypothetical protein